MDISNHRKLFQSKTMWNPSLKIDLEGSARWLNSSFHGWCVTDVLLIGWAHFLAKSRNFLMLHNMVTSCVALSPCVFHSEQIFGWHFKGSLTFWHSIFELKKWRREPHIALRGFGTTLTQYVAFYSFHSETVS